MSLLMILFIAVTVEIFFIFIAVRDDRRDRRIRDYERAVRIMAKYLGRPCVNLASDLAELVKKARKNGKEVD